VRGKTAFTGTLERLFLEGAFLLPVLKIGDIVKKISSSKRRRRNAHGYAGSDSDEKECAQVYGR
jgi:hypothetical protein